MSASLYRVHSGVTPLEVDSVSKVEIVPELARAAERRLKELDYKNVFVRAGDGYKGWEEHAPFDRIIVT